MSVARDTTARDALVRSVCARLNDDRRSEDELRVVDDVLSGLERGAEMYGALNLATDLRDFREEAAQESRDLLVYNSAENVARQHRRRERIACEVADRSQPVDTRLRTALVELRDSTTARPRALIEFEMPDLGGEA
jgi:hypothetical protein